MLREQANMEKATHRIKNNIMSEENIIIPRMNATEKEQMPNVSNYKKENNESKAINEDKWFQPKKFLPTNYFFIKKCENKT